MSIEDIKIDDLPLGSHIKDLLKKAGYVRVIDVAVENPSSLSVKMGLTEGTCCNILRIVRKHLMTVIVEELRKKGEEYRRKLRNFVALDDNVCLETGIRDLDDFLATVEPASILEISGRRKDDRTELCLLISRKMSDKGHGVIYIDTSGKLTKFLHFEKNILFYRCSDIKRLSYITTEILELIKYCGKIVGRVKLIVIDSLTEPVLDGLKKSVIEYADAVQLLNKILYELKRFSELSNCYVVITTTVNMKGIQHFNSLLEYYITHRLKIVRKGKRKLAKILKGSREH